MQTSIYKRLKMNFSKKLQKLYYGNQSEIHKDIKENLKFQLKAIKLGEEVKYFRILQE